MLMDKQTHTETTSQYMYSGLLPEMEWQHMPQNAWKQTSWVLMEYFTATEISLHSTPFTRSKTDKQYWIYKQSCQTITYYLFIIWQLYYLTYYETSDKKSSDKLTITMRLLKAFQLYWQCYLYILKNKSNMFWTYMIVYTWQLMHRHSAVSWFSMWQTKWLMSVTVVNGYE